jgi:hypothetical protein
MSDLDIALYKPGTGKCFIKRFENVEKTSAPPFDLKSIKMKK